ncbi:MAG: hypothetical protein EOO46_15150 [Flavobacterium sp.]|nr:MAG: hypothetical protein EOO46_15150 [Flavobacterium sp.]
MARFFVHLGDVDFAHDIIRKSELVKHDPWLLATEISLATLRNRGSRFTKMGIQIVESENFHPFNTTELASTLATLEMKNASLKKSKKLFETSLVHPNDNSLAQAEWASQEEKNLIPINTQQFNLINSFEANARDYAEHEKWGEAIESSKKWFLDLPFSKGSILFGNDIALNKLKNHELAVNVAKIGLVSHPNDPLLLNNIIYSLCIQNKLDEASNFLKQIKKDDIQSKTGVAICLSATKGLYFFRSGFIEAGRNLYYEAMRVAKENNNIELHSLAYINYTREEILTGTENVDELIPRLREIKKRFPGKDIIDEAEEVIKLFEDKKLKKGDSA